jgi:hypothetical protein
MIESIETAETDFMTDASLGRALFSSRDSVAVGTSACDFFFTESGLLKRRRDLCALARHTVNG